MPKPAWKQFEDLVERLHRAFHPNAAITRNDHILGKDSGRSREIDIAIRYKLGATELLLIVDCKNVRLLSAIFYPLFQELPLLPPLPPVKSVPIRVHPVPSVV